MRGNRTTSPISRPINCVNCLFCPSGEVSLRQFSEKPIVVETFWRHDVTRLWRSALALPSRRASAAGRGGKTGERVLPFFETHAIPLLRILTDRGTEYCGAREHHEYQLYRAIEDIDHSRTKARSPQSNGICERFHKTLLQEFYQVAFRKKIYHSLDELEADLDAWLKEYNESRPHSGKYCFGKTPMQTFLDSVPLAKEEMLNQTLQTVPMWRKCQTKYWLLQMSPEELFEGYKRIVRAVYSPDALFERLTYYWDMDFWKHANETNPVKLKYRLLFALCLCALLASCNVRRSVFITRILPRVFDRRVRVSSLLAQMAYNDFAHSL
jgi:hypothetical protein